MHIVAGEVMFGPENMKMFIILQKSIVAAPQKAKLVESGDTCRNRRESPSHVTRVYEVENFLTQISFFPSSISDK